MSVMRVVFVAAFALVFACSNHPAPASVAEVASEARNDELAAMAKYEYRLVRVRGKVLQKGIKRQKSIEGEPASSAEEKSLITRHYAFLVIRSSEGSDVRAICFFERNAMRQAAEVPRGGIVEVQGVLTGFSGKERAPVLNGCSVVN